MKTIARFAMLTFAICLTSALEQPTFAQVRNEATSAVLSHGSIVISTKDGFVLAADSRLTTEDGKRDDGQKLYTIGKSIACVIAGTVEAKVHSGTAPYQFELRDAVDLHLLLMDQVARNGDSLSSAKDVIPSIEFGVSRILGLAKGDSRIQPGPFVDASCASVAPDNSREWITNDFPVVEDATRSGRILKLGSHGRPHTDLTSFSLDVIGQALVAYELLSANDATEESHTRTRIMRRFYELKRLHRSNEFTLDDAVTLARDIVQATTELSDGNSGVGGPIDIVVITKDGVHWLQTKVSIGVFAQTTFPSL
jgi:Proteasome subunit